MRLVIAIVVWAAAIVGAAAVSNAVSNSIHTTPTASATSGGTSSGSSSGSSGSNSSSGPDPSSIKAADKLSLFQAANFNRVLAKARAALGPNAKVENFVVYPGYLAITAAKGNTEVDFYGDANGGVQNSTGGTPGGSQAFPLSKIAPGSAALLAHHIVTTAHTPQSQLHYLVVDADPITGKTEWLVYAVDSSPVEYFKASSPTGQLLEYRKNSSTGLQPVPGS
jgi:hypothetical protein